MTTSTPLFDDLFRKLANMALTRYNEDDFDQVAADEGYDTPAQLISADIRDYYKAADLECLFDYLEELPVTDLVTEMTFIYENRETISDYVIRLRNELKN